MKKKTIVGNQMQWVTKRKLYRTEQYLGPSCTSMMELSCGK